MKKFIRFRATNGKLEAEAMGFEGKGCATAVKQTLSKMGLSAVSGTENQKPEYLIEASKEKTVVTQ